MKRKQADHEYPYEVRMLHPFSVPLAELFIEIARAVLFSDLRDIEISPRRRGTPVGSTRIAFIVDDYFPRRNWGAVIKAIYYTNGGAQPGAHDLLLQFFRGEELPIADLKLAAKYQEYLDQKRDRDFLAALPNKLRKKVLRERAKS